MARKIFISYKYSDCNVHPINGGVTTARDYVDELIGLFEDDEIYKGEGNEDLSKFKDETIQTHLRDKIYDSSLTLVLISPNMKNSWEPESDQWIPWEVSYSLKAIARSGRTSLTNGMLAVVLPDLSSAYSYFLEENTCDLCHCRTLHNGKLFQMLGKNMFNLKQLTPNNCRSHLTTPAYVGPSSYIYSVKWEDFIINKEKYLKMAEERRDKIDDYEIRKMV